LPANRRATAVACVETTVAVGMIVGPIAGGFLTELLSWRSIFFVNWPFGLLAFALVALVVRETPSQGHPAEFDLAGALTFGSGLVLLLVGTTLGARFGWDSPLVLGMVGASVLSLALFVRIERRAPSPMIALSLFANPVFSAANLAMVCCYVCMMSAMFLSPFYYERVLGYTPAEIGLAFLPIPIGLSISSMAMGPLADRVGTRWIAPGGLLVAAIGCLLLIRVDPAGGYPAIFVGIVTLLLGLGAFIAPINSLIIGAAPPDKLGLASGFIALSRGLGMSFGLALAASLLSARLPLYESAGLPPLEAFVSAFHDVWKAALIVCLVGAGLASVQRSRNAAPAPH
jgi:predicted MFS family arabinose efflux permease